MINIYIDFETFSSAPIKTVGAYKYTESPDFEVLLTAISGEEGAVTVFDGIPTEMLKSFAENSDIIFVAHNATFERLVLAAYGIIVPPEKFLDTAALAAACGLPRSLDGLSDALGLAELGKKATGRALIKYFCVPCKPTKANGSRTRNTKEFATEKWESFREYCEFDVIAMREAHKKLKSFHYEDDVYRVSEIINDRGVLIDKDLAAAAVQMNNDNLTKLKLEMKQLTGLANPASPVQLKGWLSAELGFVVESLNKADMPQLFEAAAGKPNVIKALELRSKSSKTSVKKYDAMLSMASDVDARARGLFKYLGASRTGRYSGSGIQLQNLKRNNIEPLDIARELALAGDSVVMELMFGDVSDALSQLVRTALVSPTIFSVSDYSAIEARVLAWLADETWAIRAFENGRDLYIETYAQMSHKPYDNVTKDERAKGKIAVLACIAEGQLVTTDKGLVPIEDITTEHRVWDGEEFVTHEGVIYKGIKKVITYEGLTATEDHVVFVDGENRSIQFGEAAASGKHLKSVSSGWENFWECKNSVGRKEMDEKMGYANGTDGVYTLPPRTVDKLGQPNKREVERLSTVFNEASEDTQVVGQKVYGSKTEMHKPEEQGLGQLRRSWDRIQIRKCDRRGFVYGGEIRAARPVYGDRQDRQQQRVRTGKLTMGYKAGTIKEHAEDGTEKMGAGKKPLLIRNHFKTNEKRVDEGRYNKAGNEGCDREAQELEGDRKEVKVFDIVNAGKNHRYTVSGVLVHNCGYGGSVGALAAFGAESFMTETEMKETISDWRMANANIVKYWRVVDRAAKKAVLTGAKTRLKHGIEIGYSASFLYITLPSARRLMYYKPTIGEGMFGNTEIRFRGTNQTTGKFEEQSTRGAKMVENITQAVARDLLAHALVRAEEAGLRTVMHVHDEIVIEGADLDKLNEIMVDKPKWADGLPLDAEGYKSKYYRK